MGKLFNNYKDYLSEEDNFNEDISKAELYE